MLILPVIAAVCIQPLVGQFLNVMPAEMGPTLIRERQVHFADLPDKHIAFNPSMVRYHDQTIMVFRRDLKPGPVALETQLVLVVLDADFQPMQPHQLLDTRMPGSQHHTGEDPRLFVYRDDLYVVFNQTPDGRPDGLRKIYLGKIDVHYDAVDGYRFQLVGFSHIDVPLPNIAMRAEKNWVPLASDDAMRIAYNSNPPQVFRVPEESLQRLSRHEEIMLTQEPYWPQGKSDLWKYGEIRGGTPAIADGAGGYLACFHSGIESFLRNRYHRTYLMGCYTFEGQAPYAMTAITQEPVLPPSFFEPRDYNLIIFPGGIFELDGVIHLTYGINDETVWVGDIDKDKLIRSMTVLPP